MAKLVGTVTAVWCDITVQADLGHLFVLILDQFFALIKDTEGRLDVMVVDTDAVEYTLLGIRRHARAPRRGACSSRYASSDHPAQRARTRPRCGVARS